MSLEPYEAWLDAGLELGEADAWNDVACQPEAACAQAAAEGPAALQGCLDGYRRGYDESTAAALCPPTP